MPGALGELLTAPLVVPELALLDPLVAGLVLPTVERGVDDVSGCVAFAVAAAVAAALRPTCLSMRSVVASRLSVRATAFFLGFLVFA